MKSKEIGFDISEAVLALGLKCAVFTLSNVENRDADREFEEIKARVTKEVLTGLSLEKIASDPILQGFRQLHEAVGRSNRKYVSSAENLLKVLLQTGQLPHVNLLVDIYNLVSVKTCLSLGAHDVSAICGKVSLRLTTGEERFWPLGSDTLKPVGLGEYAYVDDQNNMLCRLEVRQGEKTKIRLGTTECFYIVQGNPVVGSEYLTAVMEELIVLTKRFCGGQERLLYVP
ncbi:MAG: tRNA ligase [Deltaproteobacteria bacterium]|nr:tRNA ligase [Deltaproteobacteria bacterium]